MRYKDFTDIGGFLWWLIIKFCRTELKNEQAKENWSRNFLFFLAILYSGTFLAFKFFNFF